MWSSIPLWRCTSLGSASNSWCRPSGTALQRWRTISPSFIPAVRTWRTLTYSASSDHPSFWRCVERKCRKHGPSDHRCWSKVVFSSHFFCYNSNVKASLMLRPLWLETICNIWFCVLFFFSGQMFHLRDNGSVFFMASPYIRAWEDLEKRTMRLADLPMWDATRDFLLSDMAYRYC